MSTALRRFVVALATTVFTLPGAFAQPVPGTTDLRPGTSPNLPASGLQKANTFVVQGGYAVAGVGLRNRGTGTIQMTGIPDNATIEAAYLYFTLLGSTDLIQQRVDANDQLLVISRDGVPTYLDERFPITRLGFSASPCWSPAYSYSYRVDVTSIVRPGNHDYAISGLPSAQTDGRDPWTSGSTSPMAEGATLVVVYSAPGHRLTQVIIHDGNFLYLGDGADTAMSIYEQASPSTLRTTFIGADGQAQSAGPHSAVDGVNVGLPWDGGDPLGGLPRPAGFSRGNLWDTLTTEPLPLARRTGTVTASLLDGSIDCVVWVAQVVAIDQADQDGCRVPMFLGADTNVNQSDDDRGFPDPGCHGVQHKRLFYGGRLGTVRTEGPWTCCIQDSRGRCIDPQPGLTEETCQFDLEAAKRARPVRTFAYWGTFGTDVCPGDVCPTTPACDGLATLTVPRVAAAYQPYARFGACQAEVLYRQTLRYSDIVLGNVLFTDIEDPQAWIPCVSLATPEQRAVCDRNRAILLGFLHQTEVRGKTPGVYTRSNYWFGHFEPTDDRRYPWDPGVDFVFWAAGDGVSCNPDRLRAVTRFPNTVMGGMKPVVWQYVEANRPDCNNDYNILTQDPTDGLRPERGWFPGQVVFSRRIAGEPRDDQE